MNDLKVLEVALALTLPFLGGAANGEENAPDMKLPAAVDELFRWLPTDTEAVVVARGSFEVLEKQVDDSRDDRSVRDSLSGLPTFLLTMIQDGLLAKRLKGERFEVALGGSRKFGVSNGTERPGLGMTLFEGCQMVQFADNSEPKVKAAFHECLSRAKGTDRIAGQQVAVFEEKLEIQDWTVFVAHPRRGLLLCATDRSYIEEVLRRMRGEGEGRALPSKLPEWRLVDVKAPVWAVRHCRLPDADVPFHPGISFVFWYDPASEKVVTVRYLCDREDIEQFADQMGWQMKANGGRGNADRDLVSDIRRIGESVIEIVPRLKAGNPAEVLFFVLLVSLGHQIAI